MEKANRTIKIVNYDMRVNGKKEGEMEKVNDNAVTFPCKRRHDELIRIVAPYSRNVSAVENMLENESLRGQMTTNTLGFTPST